MADTHFKKHLIHSAKVQRNASAASDSGELIPFWTDVGAINCRYIERSERIAAEGVGFMMLESHLLLCDEGEDVQEDDQIVDIEMKTDGSAVAAGPFSVEALLKRSGTAGHHWSLRLEKIE